MRPSDYTALQPSNCPLEIEHNEREIRPMSRHAYVLYGLYTFRYPGRVRRCAPVGRIRGTRVGRPARGLKPCYDMEICKGSLLAAGYRDPINLSERKIIAPMNNPTAAGKYSPPMEKPVTIDRAMAVTLKIVRAM